jgi:hypothetical protein
MLSRLGSGLGLLWFLLLCLAAWTWGKSIISTGSGVVFVVALSALGLVSVGWAAVLVREKHGRWLLGAVPLGALMGEILVTVAVFSSVESDSLDSWYPGLGLLVIGVFLGVPFVVGAAIGYLWLFASRRSQGDHASPRAG